MTQPSPADTLRAAADKLRNHATAAAEDCGSTTWHTTRHFPELPDSTFSTVWATGVRPLLGGGGGRGRPPAYVHAPVGDYIALMAPGVGLALADWLAETASLLDAHTHPKWQETVAPQPLAVARAILGDQP